MAQSFQLEFDDRELKKALNKTPDVVGKYMVQEMKEIRNDWRAKATDLAPIDSTNLRRRFGTRISGSLLNVEVGVSSNAYSDDFNYAYYIHEHNNGGKGVRSGVNDYLDTAGEESQSRWQSWLESALKKAIKEVGW